MLDKMIMHHYCVNMIKIEVNLMHFTRFKKSFYIVGCFKSRGW